MKNDRYLKVVLTIIAICLVWICIREISITPKLYAETRVARPEVLEVSLVDCDPAAFYHAEPITVTIENPEAIAEKIAALLSNN